MSEDNGDGRAPAPPAGGGDRVGVIQAVAVDPAGAPAAAADAIEDDTDEEEQHFDITLAASHSYMGPGLVAVGGRSVREAGWRGRVPVLAHHGAVFPGETVPMRLPNPHDASLLARAIKQDKLFGLLCPDESGTLVSGYGALCEVFEAQETPDTPLSLAFKARASHRFRIKDMPKQKVPIHMYNRMRVVEVVVLPDQQPAPPLRRARLTALDPLRARPHTHKVAALVRRLDAGATPWPAFVYHMFHYRHMRGLIQDYFHNVMDKLPEDPVSLSFWTASNLPLAARERLRLLAVDDALLRLHMELGYIARKSVLCCASCASDIARREHIFAMSSEGVHSNYTNLGGYMHDLVTVSQATNTELSGAPSAEFSWFPGYRWTVALCGGCMAHVGWRFDAMKRNLRPQQFYGLCRNYVQPRIEERDSESEEAMDESPARAPVL
ncbi:protein cereblon-like isoform X2 [Plodia interpunctella]|uniref:protein cereblon-like isoform X2 n=1 Tax=Plodia interpunctella TaxID=58824 RepID=UPI0023687CE8|nr:protein cereblon-like isoform X2 [Plodia interpunctella]